MGKVKVTIEQNGIKKVTEGDFVISCVGNIGGDSINKKIAVSANFVGRNSPEILNRGYLALGSIMHEYNMNKMYGSDSKGAIQQVEDIMPKSELLTTNQIHYPRESFYYKNALSITDVDVVPISKETPFEILQVVDDTRGSATGKTAICRILNGELASRIGRDVIPVSTFHFNL